MKELKKGFDVWKCLFLENILFFNGLLYIWDIGNSRMKYMFVMKCLLILMLYIC